MAEPGPLPYSFYRPRNGNSPYFARISHFVIAIDNVRLVATGYASQDVLNDVRGEETVPGIHETDPLTRRTSNTFVHRVIDSPIRFALKMAQESRKLLDHLHRTVG
jgi:hypothetical protein